MRFVFLPLCGALAVAVPTSANEPGPTTGATAPAAQPALQRGTLANGFRYTVLPHPTEPGRISLRLVVHAGSLDEHDDELGFAHFVEHMAFNGTEHYPPGKLVPFFQRNGIAFGVDANADTSFTHTTYKIDLPAGHGDQLGEALQILRDFADGITFRGSEVKRERGVILSELTARENNDWRRSTARIGGLFEGTRIPARIPLADARSIKTSAANELRKFYQRVYRPERMTLIAVGDIDPEAFAARIEEAFASIQGAGPKVAPEIPHAPAVDRMQAHVTADPSTRAATVTLASNTPISADGPAERGIDWADYVVLRVLDQRVKARQRQASDHVGLASAGRGKTIDGRFRYRALEVQAQSGAWKQAIGIVENELRRLCESGLTESEFSEMTAALLANARAICTAAKNKTPKEASDELVDSIVSGNEWISPEVELAAVQDWVAHFTRDEALASARSLFPAPYTHLFLRLQDTADILPADLLTTFTTSATQPLAEVAASSPEALAFRYNDFGAAGQVKAHQDIADLGVELVEFENGTKLNLRASESEPGRFKLVAHLGRGFADIPTSRAAMPWLAFNLIGCCDLGRHTRPELGRLIRMRAIDAGADYDNTNGFTVSLEGPAAELPFALSFLTGLISDVKLEEGKLVDAKSAQTAQFVSFVTDSEKLSLIDLGFHIRADDPRFGLCNPSQTSDSSFEEAADWARKYWLDGPLEIALCGDLDPPAAIAAAAGTVGTLPPRPALDPLGAPERCEFPQTLYRNLTPVPMPAQAATVQFAWVARDLADARKRHALILANAILRDRLRETLREQKGATYSPVDRVEWMVQQPDFGFANIAITFDPNKAQNLAERVLTIADEFARKGAKKDELLRARAPLVAQAKNQLHQNSWWLENVLARAQSSPESLDEARTRESDFASLTLDEVNRAAKEHFGLGSAHVAGIVPKAPVPTK